MLRRVLRLWRSHPISTAALIGAIVGVANAVAIEFGGLVQRNSSGVLSLLWSPVVPPKGQVNALQTALLLLIEIAANVLVFAALFATPVALAIGIRHVFKSNDQPMADAGSLPDRADESETGG